MSMIIDMINFLEIYVTTKKGEEDFKHLERNIMLILCRMNVIFSPSYLYSHVWYNCTHEQWGQASWLVQYRWMYIWPILLSHLLQKTFIICRYQYRMMMIETKELREKLLAWILHVQKRCIFRCKTYLYP